MLSCPGEETLRSLGTDALGDAAYAAIEEHVEGCLACKAVLDRLARGGDGPPAFPPDPERWPPVPDFTIERELGRGAMGVVYLAHRDLPRRQVALKLIPGGRRAGPRERRQWLREAEAAAAVRHPHIVMLHEAGVTDDWFLLALEYVPGGTLADRLAGPIAPRAAARIAGTIARAVHHIHRSGLLHLDLKPSNILLDGDAAAGWDGLIPRVTDFGIARAADPAATDTGGACPGGTPSYMAPEQITRPRREMTAQADIHGLGAILYHMLTGRPPYQGATVLETIDLLQRQEPVPPRRMNPQIPRDLETICLKCLNKDPARRYDSAEALAADLELWQGGRPIAARPVSAAGKTWRWCRRRPVIAALAAALMLTLSVGFVAVVSLWRRAEANLRTSTDILNDLIDLTVGGENGLPRVLTVAERIQVSRRIRERFIDLLGKRLDSVAAVNQLYYIEARLIADLGEVGRSGDARAVLSEALTRLDALVRRHPGEVGLREHYHHCLASLADMSRKAGDFGEAGRYYALAVQSSEEGLRIAPTTERVRMLAFDHTMLAWVLRRRGDHERASALAAANCDLLDGVRSESERRRLLPELLLADLYCELSVEDSSAEASCAVRARRSRESGTLPGRGAPADRSGISHVRAMSVARAFHSTRADAKKAESHEAAIALDVIREHSARASAARRRHEPEKARRTAESLLAVANDLVATYPEQPAAHLALKEAYLQRSKDARLAGDTAAVEANLRSALDAARSASRLDPANEGAQRALAGIQRRLGESLPKG